MNIRVREFYEKYGRLPTERDPDWRREVEQTHTLSRIQVLDYPVMAPGRCSICGSTAVARKYFDLGVDLDSTPGFNYTVYLCSMCVLELIALAKANGVYAEPPAVAAVPSPHDIIAEIKQNIEKVRSDIRDITRSFPSSEPTVGVSDLETKPDSEEFDGSERETNNTDNGSDTGKGPSDATRSESNILNIGKFPKR